MNCVYTEGILQKATNSISVSGELWVAVGLSGMPVVLKPHKRYKSGTGNPSAAGESSSEHVADRDIRA